MVRIYYSEYFRRRAGKLDKKQQSKLTQLVGLLRENPYHPQLHTKSLSGKFSGIYSFRITKDYRALFKFLSPDQILLVDVGDRKDIYK